MVSCTIVSAEVKPVTYPVLMENAGEEGTTIVLFSGPNTGVVVATTYQNPQFPFGTRKTDWKMDKFKLFGGKVRLKNGTSTID